MSSTLHRPLTKLSFRRDVKLFLTILVGFFIVLISTLLLLLQQVLAESRDVTWRYWNTVADAAAQRAATATNAEAALTAIRGQHGVVGGDVRLRRGGRAAVGVAAGGGEGVEVLTRGGDWGELRIAFDAAPLEGLRRTLLLTSAIVLSGALAALVLVLLFIPRITGPIEQMLDHAAELGRRDPEVDEQEFLIETFRTSVVTLKAQQEELRVLHDAQKSRADDFERVTAALMRGLTSGLLAIGPDGRVVEVNDAAREMLHLAADNVVGRDLSAALGEGDFATVLRDALGRRAPLTRVETTHRTRDGASLIIGVTTVPLLNEAGDLLGMLALFTDLTSIRSLETRVRDLQALADLGEMSAGIAHEFRNSLSAILGYLKLAQRQGTAEEITGKLRRAEDEATQLSAAVASLLSFARPMAMTPEEIRLRELVDSVIDRLQPASDGTASDGTAFDVTGDAVVQGDRALLSRAVENVLRNAVESTREKGNGGRVEVEIDATHKRITVRDHGVGIDPQQAARMFLPFQSEKPNGFGLGLALTRKIVLLHGGAIRLTGTPGHGATVEMDLG